MIAVPKYYMSQYTKFPATIICFAIKGIVYNTEVVSDKMRWKKRKLWKLESVISSCVFLSVAGSHLSALAVCDAKWVRSLTTRIPSEAAQSEGGGAHPKTQHCLTWPRYASTSVQCALQSTCIFLEILITGYYRIFHHICLSLADYMRVIKDPSFETGYLCTKKKMNLL